MNSSSVGREIDRSFGTRNCITCLQEPCNGTLRSRFVTFDIIHICVQSVFVCASSDIQPFGGSVWSLKVWCGVELLKMCAHIFEFLVKYCCVVLLCVWSQLTRQLNNSSCSCTQRCSRYAPILAGTRTGKELCCGNIFPEFSKLYAYFLSYSDIGKRSKARIAGRVLWMNYNKLHTVYRKMAYGATKISLFPLFLC